MLQVSPLTSYHHRRFWRARRSLSNMFKNTIRVNTFRPSTPRTMNSGGNSRVSTSTAICPALQPTSWQQSKTYISIALLNLPRWLNTVKGGETGLTSPLISTPSLPTQPMKGCTTSLGSTPPTLYEQQCWFFYVPQELEQWMSCEMAPTVFCPYPRRLECLTNCRCHIKGSTFSSVILRP